MREPIASSSPNSEPSHISKLPAVRFQELTAVAPDLVKEVLDLAVFISRQPRFAGIAEAERPDLVENIQLRLMDGFANGRRVTVVRSAETERPSILAYLVSKETGEFAADRLRVMHEFAQLGSSPAIIFRNFVLEDLPNFQVSGVSHESWDLSGSFRYLFSLYESNRDRTGSVGMLMLAEVAPEVRRLGLSSVLLHEVLRGYRERGTEFVIAFARCAQLRVWEPDPARAAAKLQEYVALRDATGLHPDYGIRFHQKAGAIPICGIPNCATDPTAHNHMCLVVYRMPQGPE